MQQVISKLLAGYETGQVGRRQLIQSLAALTAGATAAATPPGTFQGVGFNHVAIRVTDVKRSRDFYQKHFGLRWCRNRPTTASWEWARTS